MDKTKCDIAFREVYNLNSFHPLKEKIEKTKWDGEARIPTLFHDWLCSEDNEINRMISTIFLKSMIKRLYEPGCDLSTMLILIGAQGTLKTSFLRELSGGYIIESLSSMESKIVGEQTSGAWIVSLEELNLFKKEKSDTVKEFITRTKEIFRPAYGKHEKEVFRNFVLAAATNEAEFLKDDTGNRRFLPVVVGSSSEINHERFHKEFRSLVPQIWAEALELYKSNADIQLAQEYWKPLDELRKSFTYENPYEEEIKGILDELGWPEKVSLEQVYKELSAISSDFFATSVRKIEPRAKRLLKSAIQNNGYQPHYTRLWINKSQTRNGFVKKSGTD